MYFKKKVPDFRISTYVSTILLFDYYKAFISHKNLHSPMQVLFTKIQSMACCTFNVLLRLLIWAKFINVAIVMQNWNNIESSVYVSTAALLPTFLITKKSRLSISVHFHQNSLIVTCYIYTLFVDSKSQL